MTRTKSRYTATFVYSDIHKAVCFINNKASPSHAINRSDPFGDKGKKRIRRAEISIGEPYELVLYTHNKVLVDLMSTIRLSQNIGGSNNHAMREFPRVDPLDPFAVKDDIR